MVKPLTAERPALVGCAVRGVDVSEVKAADVQVGEASDYGDEAEDEADAETDEIEGVHVIWCSALAAFFRAG